MLQKVASVKQNVLGTESKDTFIKHINQSFEYNWTTKNKHSTFLLGGQVPQLHILVVYKNGCVGMASVE
jgi:hypothetical protein